MERRTRTKIIATIGPASATKSMLTKMVKSGLSVARLNFSHGDLKSHGDSIKNIRQIEKKTGVHLAILQDLPGVKIRLGLVEDRELKTGERVEFVFGKEKALEGQLPISNGEAFSYIEKGHRILLADGEIECEVLRKGRQKLIAEVKNAGKISSHKGVNLPDSYFGVSALTEFDKKAISFGVENEVDWIALSFVEDADFVKKAKSYVTSVSRSNNKKRPLLMVKIERARAVDGFSDILDEADGILIARGDLGIEIPFEEVPVIQKDIISMCRLAGKPVIVATHMLESMVRNPRATRAEVSDVANAVIDGADAVMLSAESAIGSYPNIAVQTMNKIILETEETYYKDDEDLPYASDRLISLMSQLRTLSLHGHIDGLVVRNFDLLSHVRVAQLSVPVYFLADNLSSARASQVYYGVEPLLFETGKGMFDVKAKSHLIKRRLIKSSQVLAYLDKGTAGDISLILK